ncbi:MAG: segregation and condensation protein A [Eubacteriales bacterium]
MESITYRLDQFEGPLDLLLTLIHKNKVNIEDIPIALICDQYMQYINEAQSMDLDIASEFIVMASDLMLIKSKLLLPREKEDEEDPRKALSDALLRYQQAKEASAKMQPLYAVFSGRQIKDTDEISVDKTFVADQDVEALYRAMRRIVDFNEALDNAKKNAFTPMIAKPIVPVEHKILQIMTRLTTNRYQKLEDFISDSVSLPDMIAIFLGVLELVKTKRILLVEDEDNPEDNYGVSTVFTLNENYVPEENTDANEDDKEKA